MSFSLHDPNTLADDFEQVIISVILFFALFASGIKISFMLAAHTPLVLSCFRNPSALAADFEQVIVLVNCFLPCLIPRY